MPRVLEYFLFAILLTLPLDIYMTLAGHSVGVYLSQVLTVEASALLLITVLMARGKHVHLPIRFAWRDAFPLSAILIAGLASTIFSDFRSAALKNVLKIVIYLGIFMLARALSAVPGMRERAVPIFLVGFGLVFVTGLTQVLPGIPNVMGAILNIQQTAATSATASGVSATFRAPDELASYLALMIMLFLANAIVERERALQVCYVLVLVAGFWLLAMTGDRSALIAVLVVTPTLLLLLKQKTLMIMAAVGVVVVLGVLVLHGGSGYSARSSAWGWAASVFLHHPIFGVGIGTMQYQPGAPYAQPALAVKVTNGENLYLNVLAEMGIVGFGVVMIAFVAALYRAWRHARYSI
jgi:O-antigen ligase